MHTHVQNPTHSFSDFCKQQDKYEKDSLEASRLNQYYVQTAWIMRALACCCVVCGSVCAHLTAFKLVGKIEKSGPKQTNWDGGEQQSAGSG